MFPGKHSGGVRTAGHTKLASDASVVVDENDPIRAFIGGTNRTNTDAEGVVAVETGFGKPVRRGFFGILKEINLHKLLAFRQVVSFLACLDAFTGVLAFPKVDNHDKLPAGNALMGFLGGDAGKFKLTAIHLHDLSAGCQDLYLFTSFSGGRIKISGNEATSHGHSGTCRQPFFQKLATGTLRIFL
jgi:hypothetical protein